MTPKNKVEEALSPLTTKLSWVTENFWTPEEVVERLNGLTEEQASAAKVFRAEIKLTLMYPLIKQVDTVEGF